MTDPARLVLVRHARPGDEGVRVFGSLDVALGDVGYEQAAGLIETLADVPVAAVYSSPLVRALHTARPLAEHLGLEPVVVPDLREIDFGELEGLEWPEVRERFSSLMGWSEAPSGVSFPGGESVAALNRRAVAAGRAIVAAHPGETVVVVSHGVTLRAILADALGMPLDALFRIELSHCGLSVIDWFGERPLVRTVNGIGIGV
jgi:broad specificity phosphatase PhoE